MLRRCFIFLLLGNHALCTVPAPWPCDPRAIMVPVKSPTGTLTFTSSGCKCKEGLYGDGLKCESCEVGKYQSMIGMETCSMCPKGTFSNITEATSKDACIPCHAGTFASQEGSSHCTECIAKCEKNHFFEKKCASMHDAVCMACIECPVGSYVFEECTKERNTVCDVNQTTFVVFTVMLKLNSVQFTRKARTYLVSVGETVFGIPTVDASGELIDDWEKLSIPQKLKTFRGLLALGDITEKVGPLEEGSAQNSTANGSTTASEGQHRSIRS